MPGLISQNGNFYANDASSAKISLFQISFKSVKPFGHKKRLRILQLPILYCVSLIMVTITSHIFINIFQTVHFSAVKFARGNEKNMSFLLISKSESLKKIWSNRTGTFKYHLSMASMSRCPCKKLKSKIWGYSDFVLGSCAQLCVASAALSSML